MTIWDDYKKECYEVIPVKKIEEKIEEYSKRAGNLEFGEWHYKREALQQLIEENCECEE